MRRPGGDQEEVGGQAPGGVRLEHVVLEHEVLGVRPVIGDVGAGVVAHDVGRGGLRADGVVGVATAAPPMLGLGNEAIHLAAIHVGRGGGGAVGSAAVEVVGVVVGLDAGVGGRVGDADGWYAV